MCLCLWTKPLCDIDCSYIIDGTYLHINRVYSEAVQNRITPLSDRHGASSLVESRRGHAPPSRFNRSMGKRPRNSDSNSNYPPKATHTRHNVTIHLGESVLEPVVQRHVAHAGHSLRVAGAVWHQRAFWRDPWRGGAGSVGGGLRRKICPLPLDSLAPSYTTPSILGLCMQKVSITDSRPLHAYCTI